MNKETATREALSELEARRAENQSALDARRAQAAEKSGEIDALLKRRESLFFSGMRRAFAAPEQAMDISSAMGGEVQRVNAALREALVRNGFPEDYLQPQYQCPICRDTGYVGEPVHEMCVCLRQAVLRRLYQNEGLRQLETENFSTFDEAIFSDAPMPDAKYSQRVYIQKIRERCERYADGFDPATGEGMLLFGKPGLGKTFLMNCIAQRVLERGYSVVVVSAYRLIERMRRYLFDGEDGGQVADILNCDLLCIDDLGSEPVFKNTTMSSLYHVVSERHSARRAVVVTTNCSVKDLYERYDPRITARLCDQRRVQVIEFIGRDVRA